MPTETSKPAPLRVLYDGGCPLCRREIAHYQRLSPRRAIQWIDIDADRDQPLPLGLTREHAMARFHVLDGEDIQTGAHAFLWLWSALPGWRHLGRMVRLLHLTGWLEQGYVWFARRRLRQRCREGACRVG
jgi:predicted DCC family thiol-disulfide oxidoreductase YuxK